MSCISRTFDISNANLVSKHYYYKMLNVTTELRYSAGERNFSLTFKYRCFLYLKATGNISNFRY